MQCGDGATPSTRSAGSPRPRASTASTPRAVPWRWPARPDEAGPARDVADETYGFGEDDLLAARRGRGRGADHAVSGARRDFTPHCAASTPRGWSAGWPGWSRRRGVNLFERTAATEIAARHGGAPTAARCGDVVVRATEAYTPALPGAPGRDTVYSLIVATEPLPASCWAELGLAGRRTFTDGRHLLIYGQRTADGRLAFGGRGAPYHLGSRDPAVLRPRPRGVRRRWTRHAGRCSRRWGRAGHAPLGRTARGRARLVRRRRPGPRYRVRLGRRVCRRRRGHRQSGRPHAGRPDPPPGHRPDPCCRGSATAPGAGSRSRCAGPARPRSAGWPPRPTWPRPAPARRPAAPPSSPGSPAAGPPRSGGEIRRRGGERLRVPVDVGLARRRAHQRHVVERGEQHPAGSARAGAGRSAAGSRPRPPHSRRPAAARRRTRTRPGSRAGSRARATRTRRARRPRPPPTAGPATSSAQTPDR